MNIKPFNRSGFNRPGTAQTVGNSGIALLKLGAIPVFANRDINSLQTRANLVLEEETKATNVKFGNSSISLNLTAEAESTKVVAANAEIAVIIMGTSASQSVQGEAVITLEGLLMHPGDELIINTCDMTVVLNGQNGMQYFSDDSEIFNLLSGQNEIIYSDGSTSREIVLDVIWKDRWL